MRAIWNRAAAVLIASATVAACAPSTKVSVTANATAQYSHVYLTVSSLWFNTSAAAGPDDSTWLKYPLSAPVTVDLAADESDAVVELATNLKLTPGTYAQVRLFPVDSSVVLTASATKVGALFNAEADYTDSNGDEIRAPLELLNPEKGIALSGSLKIPRGEISDDTTATPAAFSLGLSLDAARDLLMINDGSDARVVLNPHGSAYDLSLAGAITGTVEVAALSSVTFNNGRSNIQVTAETLSADGSRHIPVASVAVKSDGSFMLYPLSTDATTPTYDLVIHGPSIATVIIRGVGVTAGVATATTTASVGSIAPRDAGGYTVNVAPTGSATLPAGAVVRFYQTLPGSGEVPYTIEQNAIEPFTRTFASDFQVNDATIDTGSFVTSGATIPLTAQTPLEGAGVYRLAGSAPLYLDGALTTTVAPSGTSSTTSAVSVTVPSLSVATGATSSTVTATVSKSVFSTFDRGELILSHDGAVVGVASLNSLLTQGNPGVVTLDGLPGGTSSTTFDAGLYYISLRAWNSTDPAGTLVRETYFSAVDLRSASTAAISVPIN